MDAGLQTASKQLEYEGQSHSSGSYYLISAFVLPWFSSRLFIPVRFVKMGPPPPRFTCGIRSCFLGVGLIDRATKIYLNKIGRDYIEKYIIYNFLEYPDIDETIIDTLKIKVWKGIGMEIGKSTSAYFLTRSLNGIVLPLLLLLLVLFYIPYYLHTRCNRIY